MEQDKIFQFARVTRRVYFILAAQWILLLPWVLSLKKHEKDILPLVLSGAIFVSIYILLAKTRVNSLSMRNKIILLVVATFAQWVFFAGLVEVHPVFVLVIGALVTYPIGMAAADFEEIVWPELQELGIENDYCTGTAMVYTGTAEYFIKMALGCFYFIAHVIRAWFRTGA